MVSAREVEAKLDLVDVEPGFDPELEIQPRGLIKRLLPRTMFGRSLLIVIMPLVMLQAIATWMVVFWAETPIISEPRQAIGLR